MVMSEKLRQRFCKDCGLSFSIYEEPVFSDRIELYDEHYSTKAKFNLFLEAISKFNSEEDYFAMYTKVKEAAINHVKASSGYESFNKLDMNTFSCVNKIPSTNIFKPSNDRRRFISIDMREANFSALNYYSSSIFNVNGKASKNWKEFISNFTDISHIICSKYVRQVILGNCNPKRHITFEKYLMDSLATALLSEGVDNIVSMTNDELVIDVTDASDIGNIFINIQNCINKSLLPFKMQYFELVKVFRSSHSDSYIKLPIEGMSKLEIKGASPYEMPIILRALKGEDITESDKLFTFEHQLCKFQTVPKIEEEILCHLKLS